MVSANTTMSGQEGGVLQLTPSLQPDEQHGAANEDAVLKLKGLPYSTTEAQIYEFFADYKVKTVAFVSEPDGRPSGLAFAEFENKEEALKALSRNGEYIGERYVRLLHVPKTEMEEQVRLGTLAIPGAAAKLRARLLRNQMQQARLASGGYLATAPLLVSNAQVLMQAGAPGRPLLTMHPQHAPGQATSLLAGATAGYPALNNGMDARLWHNYAAGPPLHQQFAGLSLGMESAGVSRTPAAAFSQLSPHMQPSVSSGLVTPSGTATGPARAVFMQPSVSSSGGASYLTGSSTGALSNGAAAHHLPAADAQLSGQHSAHANGASPLGAGISMTSSHANGRANVFGPAAGASAGGGVMLSGYGLPINGTGALAQLLPRPAATAAGMLPLNGNFSPVGTTSVAACASLLSTTSATVKVRGLPYRSSPAEILGFFSGYQYLPDSLQLGLDASGRPSGEAWLSFASPAEAARAVRELNRHYLGTRYLELSVC